MPILWQHFPLAPGYMPADGISLYLFLLQLWRAPRERNWAVGAEFWPRTSIPYDADPAVSYARSAGYTGVIGSITASGNDYVVTVPGKAWPANRWFGSPPDPDFPNFYDLIIEVNELDPWQVVRVPIIAQPDGDQLKLDGEVLDDWFTAWAPTLTFSDAAARGCIIEKRDEASHRSVHWHERWPEPPNATAYASGQCTVFAPNTIEDLSAHMLTVPATGLGKWVGKQLIISVDVGSGVVRLKRFTITAHTNKRITVVVPGGWTLLPGEYAVVDVNAKWAPGRAYPKAPAWPFYRGIRGPMTGITRDPRVYSHVHGAGVVPVPFATPQVRVMQLDDTGSICIEKDVDALHVDLWSRTPPADPFNPDRCDAADRPYAPDLYKSPSALQKEAEETCYSYVNRRVNWHGANIPPQNFTAATLFRAMAATAYGKTAVFVRTIFSSVESGNGFVTFSPITLPQIRKPPMSQAEIAAEILPVKCHYAILGPSEKPLDFGYSYAFRTQGGVYPYLHGELVSTSQLNLRGATINEANASVPPYPLDDVKMQEFVGKTLVIAFGWDRWLERQVRWLNPKSVLLNASHAVTTTNPGAYITRAASTTYCESSPIGTTEETAIPFKANELCRYVGDRWHDPTTTDAVYDGKAPDTDDRDRFYTTAQPRLIGASTEAASWYIRDTSRSQEGDTPERSMWGVGVARVDTFTASAGTTTTVANSGGDPTYWGGGDGRMVGFIVEVNELPDGSGAWHRRPVTAYNAGTKTLTVSPAFPFTTNGKPARIREPYVVNDYAGPYRQIVFWIDGTIYMPKVLYNDDDTFYFADIGVTIPAGTLYTTDEPQPGEVLKYLAATGTDPARFWRTAYGPDPRGGNNPLLTDTRENCPTLIRRFGRMQKDDLITADLLNQLYAADNEMADRREDGSWQLGNTKSVVTLIGTPYSQDKLQNQIVADWAASTAVPTDIFSIPLPTAQTTFDTDITGKAVAAFFDAVISASPTRRIQCSVDAFAYTSSDPNDYGIHSRIDPPLGDDVNRYFRAHGSGALYRRWSRIGSEAVGIHPSVSVRVGDRGGADSLQDAPTDWPPPAAPAYPDNLHVGGWSVALENGDGDPAPALVYHFGVEGGFGYRDNGTGPLLPLPGVPLSGMAVLTM